jgi:hypothetical protein
LFGGKKFYYQVGLGGEDYKPKTNSELLMEISLGMSMNFHSSPEYWLDMPLANLLQWLVVAGRLMQKRQQQFQHLGPGL